MAGAPRKLMTDDVRQVIGELDEPVFSVPEIAARVDASGPTVQDRLEELHENGEIGKKEVGSRAIAWWDVQRL